MGFIGNRRFEGSEAGFDNRKFFKLSEGSRSPNQKRTEMGLNNTSRHVPERARSCTTIIRGSRKMVERGLESVYPVKKRREIKRVLLSGPAFIFLLKKLLSPLMEPLFWRIAHLGPSRVCERRMRMGLMRRVLLEEIRGD